MAPQDEATSVRNACTTIASCDAKTVATLSRLLGSGKPETVTKDSKNARSVTVKTVRATTRPVPVKRNAREQSGPRQQTSGFCQKEQHALATEVVNATLKSLTELLKSGLKNGDQPARVCDTKAAAPATRNVSIIQPLQNDTKSPAESKATVRSPVVRTVKDIGHEPGLVAIAECSRLAFAWLRTRSDLPIDSESSSRLQIEQGTLALISKFMALGLETLAIKELRLLKRSFERRSGTELPTAIEKETLASLLCVDLPANSDHYYPLLVNYHSHVLKLLMTTGSSATIEVAVDYLDPTRPASPSCVILHTATVVDKAKVSKQLETLAATLLAIALDKTRPGALSAESVFKLQSFALQVRQRWWQLAGHQANLGKELYRPLLQALELYQRKSSLAPSDQYILVKTVHESTLAQLVKGSARSSPNEDLDSLLQILSLMADAAGQHEESSELLCRLPTITESQTRIQESIVIIRSITSELEQSTTSPEVLTESYATRLRHCLEFPNGLKSLETQLILSELARLRKVLSRMLTATKTKRDRGGSDTQVLTICDLVFACLHFIRYYIFKGDHRTDRSQRQLTSSKSSAQDETLSPFVELAVFAAKLLLSKDGDVRLLRDVLDQVSLLLPAIRRSDDHTLSVHASNTMWTLFQTTTRLPDEMEISLSSDMLKGSVDCLITLPQAVQEQGFLGVKFERLCKYLIESKYYREALRQCRRAISISIQHGSLKALSDCIIRPSYLSSTIQRSNHDEGLRGLLSLHHLAAIKSKQPSALYIDERLDAEDRTILLDLQLSLILGNFPKYGQNDQLKGDLNLTISTLDKINNGANDIIRQIRLGTQTLLIAFSCPDTLNPDLIAKVVALDTNAIESTTGDAKLSYAKQLTLAFQFVRSIHNQHTQDDIFMATLQWWQDVARAASSPNALFEELGDPLEILQILHVAKSYFGVHGMDHALLRVLRLAVIFRRLLPEAETSSQLMLAQCDLAAQCLVMGLFEEANAISNNIKGCPDLARQTGIVLMRVHLLACELALCTNDLSGASVSFSAFNKLALDKSCSSVERLDLYQSQADAGYLYSCYLSKIGAHGESVHFAKEALRLYRSLIASVEQVSKKKRSGQSDDTDATVSALVQTFESLKINGEKKKSEQDVMESAVKTTIWRFGPGLFSILIHLSKTYASQGMRPEADYYTQQAAKFTQTLSSVGLDLQLHTLQLQHACLSGSSRPEISQKLQMQLASSDSPRKSLIELMYNVAEGDLLVKFGDAASAIKEFEEAEAIVQWLEEPEDPVTDAPKSAVVPPTKSKPRTVTAIKAVPKSATTRTGKASKPSTTSRRPAPGTRKIVKSDSAIDSKLPEIDHLARIRADIHRHKALAHLANEDVEAASKLLQTSILVSSACDDPEYRLVAARNVLARVQSQVLTDVTYNALPESTLALPGLNAKEVMQDGPRASLLLSSPQANSASTTVTGTRGRSKDANIGILLGEMRERIATSLSLTVASRSLSLAYQTASLNTNATLLSSAAASSDLGNNALHPTRLAHSFELPSIEACRRQIDAIATDKRNDTLQELLAAKLSTEDLTPDAISAARFQREYIDIIPKSWTAVSIGMNEDCTELWLARYRSDQSPFVLRLPMARHKANDLDEELTFDFETGKSELRDIIECSDYSCHHAPDTSTQGAKSEWWAEREALDQRLRELLANIENIWFGGFKGILSQQPHRPDLLARFRKSLDNILDRHLPSRQSTKVKPKKLSFDFHVLQLFVSLSSSSDDDTPVDLDDHVLDLLYFVTDLLAFNGEPNAYDEIDFDSMTLETVDAINTYQAADTPSAVDSHTILILDKRLHSIPWESIPCLQSNSVSRLPSLHHLRERILALRRQSSTSDSYLIPRLSGTYILNPSSDLQRTQSTLSPYLTALPSWTGISAHAPNESEFTTALTTSNTLLYFGHGSGNQYIRPRQIRKLDKCAATVWLIGCSSGLVAENGGFEPNSVPLSYLLAGESAPPRTCLDTRDEAERTRVLDERKRIAEQGREGVCMAVLATLWDVTDRDIDRFSITVGQKWGLFAKEQAPVPKTPAKKGKEKAVPKTPAKGKTPGKKKTSTNDESAPPESNMSLVAAVARSRDACYLKYLNGAAAVVYGVPTYMGD